MSTIAHQSENATSDTKQYIINTARRLFSEYSYLGVSMSDIAKKLNITKAALYYHFTGKAEIYEEVLDGVFDDLNLIIAKTSSGATIDKKLRTLIKNYLDFGFKEKNLIKALVVKLPSADSQITKHIAQLREGIADRIRPTIEQMIASKKSTKKIDSWLLALMLTSMMDGLLLEYSFIDKKINSMEVANQILAVLF